jgi:hypothetical protein
MLKVRYHIQSNFLVPRSKKCYLHFSGLKLNQPGIMLKLFLVRSQMLKLVSRLLKLVTIGL